MDSLINFFMSIDGLWYYVMVVVNTILIFAIIGYLQEREEKSLLQYEKANAPLPVQPVQNSSTNVTRNGYSSPIPTVSKTVAPSAISTMEAATSQNRVSSTLQVNGNDGINGDTKAPAVLIINSNDKN